MAVKIASEWLNSCSGCEISIVDMGARLLDVLSLVEFVHIPVLIDHKYYGQCGEKDHIDIPEAAVGIITGGIRNEEHLEVALEMRKKCGTIIALGTCATHGGIPALCNSSTTEDIFKTYYTTVTTDPVDAVPHEGIPELLDRCYALDEKIHVDVMLPGCPPHSDQIAAALMGLLKGEPAVLESKSVCDTCPTIRKGKGNVKKLSRFLHAPAGCGPHEAVEDMPCLLEQGFLCMGAVTRGGCGGDAVTPRCLLARVPCRGCYGPVRHDGNQQLDMLNILASNGISISTLPETVSLLRFSGAHGRLVPKLQKEA